MTTNLSTLQGQIGRTPENDTCKCSRPRPPLLLNRRRRTWRLMDLHPRHPLLTMKMQLRKLRREDTLFMLTPLTVTTDKCDDYCFTCNLFADFRQPPPQMMAAAMPGMPPGAFVQSPYMQHMPYPPNMPPPNGQRESFFPSFFSVRFSGLTVAIISDVCSSTYGPDAS